MSRHRRQLNRRRRAAREHRAQQAREANAMWRRLQATEPHGPYLYRYGPTLPETVEPSQMAKRKRRARLNRGILPPLSTMTPEEARQVLINAWTLAFGSPPTDEEMRELAERYRR